MNSDFDLVLLGSGFGGALTAMIARRLGRSVLLLERGTHPRFAIGESTSPLTNLILEELAVRYDLPRLLPFTTWGAWQKHYPEVGGGLKRGFTYYHHRAGEPFENRPDRSDQLMVAASPRDEIGDTHWLRADVDHFLVREAIALGAEYQDETQARTVEWQGGEVATLTGERRGRPFTVRARLVIDATGPHGFLSRALRLPEAEYAGYPPTQSLFSHFTGVRRCDEMEAFRPQEPPPYAPDDAALHHVFDGGWMWVLRFQTGVTSAGFAVTEPLANTLALAEGASAWLRFLGRFPSLREQFEEAEPLRPFTYAPRLAYRSSVAAGEGWALLPSAAGFVDPLFSTGIPLTLLGIERLGRLLEERWGGDAWEAGLKAYGQTTLQELDWTARFIAACYRAFPRFPQFAAFSMFYFAVASFSEIARRVDRRSLPGGFLGGAHPAFAPGLHASARELELQGGRLSETAFAAAVRKRIACLNVAGLADPAKRNWYPVDLADVVAGAGKLGYSPAELQTLLANAPWV